MTALHLLVVVLTVVAAVAEYHPPQPNPPYAQVYESKPEYSDTSADGPVGVGEAVKAVKAVNEARFKLITDLSKYQTLLEVATESISLVNLRILPAIRLDNSQTDDIISLLEEEINALSDRAARADVTVTAGLGSANGSSETLGSQRTDTTQISKNNTDDARSISQFQDDLRKFQTYFLKDLDTQLGQLSPLVTKERQDLDNVTTFLDSRKCEYGFVVLLSNIDKKSVQFVSEFTQSPVVNIVLSAHISSINVPLSSPDGNSYPPRSTYNDHSKQGEDSSSFKSDEQNVQIVVSDVTTQGFTARVINTSPVNLYFDGVGAVYAACQNLDSEVHL
ncbi:uncharacterized protein LOC112562078 [Pomacea canaliculata]|uniref:uncharacterized protein LOC112562078 n=1 Tax=Pomacea canaliculata TaxID=400727 RepID=UPI000D73D817|nr:uncharacterized protein LOC112562078 [Pomacea canaliculata]